MHTVKFKSFGKTSLRNMREDGDYEEEKGDNDNNNNNNNNLEVNFSGEINMFLN